MSDEQQEMKSGLKAPAAIVKPGRSFSIIWVVPIIAMLIGGWLAIKAWSEKGPEITISFETAEGLEADKTRIRFKEVEVGKVTRIEMKDDLSGVIVTAEMDKSFEKYMRAETSFWVVRARVAAGEVSGLGTLFSGAYIGCSPSTQGKAVYSYTGLEKPPVVTSGMPGRHFILQAQNLGSLDVGSPVYYRGIKVGQVVEYEFDEAADAVKVRVFIDAPYHEKVYRNTRFWNASGIKFDLNTEGVSVDTQSLVSVMLGGIAFDLPHYMAPVAEAEEGQLFRLYDNREKIEERSYTIRQFYMMYFNQNIRGLLPGAPVEMRGIPIGEVVDVSLEVNVEDVSASAAVLVMIEPERIDAIASKDKEALRTSDRETENALRDMLSLLVRNGLRAQLKTGSLLTGQLYIDLDFYEDAEAARIEPRNGYLVMPTLPAPFEQIAQSVSNILKRVEKMPLEEFSRDLLEAINNLNNTLQAVEEVAGGVNKDVIPELRQALDSFQQTMSGIDNTLGPDSALNFAARSILTEMNATIRSLRALIDYVERNPQSVIFGKEEE